MHNFDCNKTRLLIKEKQISWNSFLSKHKPKMEYYSITNKFNRIAFSENINKDIYDVYLFDIDEKLRDEINFLKTIKKYNPSMKTILVTSEKNRRVRGQIAIDLVDHVIFRETDLDLLHQVLNFINLRLTRTRSN
jgi:DNA-binding NtrC family response regulator